MVIHTTEIFCVAEIAALLKKLFFEELPGVNSHGRTLDEARDTLQKLAAVVFDEERREAEELIAGKDVVRENFVVPIPRPAEVDYD